MENYYDRFYKIVVDLIIGFLGFWISQSILTFLFGYSDWMNRPINGKLLIFMLLRLLLIIVAIVIIVICFKKQRKYIGIGIISILSLKLLFFLGYGLLFIAAGGYF